MTSEPLAQLHDLLLVSDSGTWGTEGGFLSGSQVLRSTNISDYRLDVSDVAWRSIPRGHRSSKRLEPGDILVTASSGSADHIGKCCLFEQPQDGHPYYFSNFTLRLRVDPQKADPRWLYHWLKSDRGRATLGALSSTTTGLRNLNKALYLSQKLSVPTLAEQRRIAAILDKADAVRRKRRESLRLLDEFLCSAFLEMFGDPVRNEKGWDYGPASAAISGIQAGTSVKGGEEPRGPHDWAVLKISAVTSGWYLPDECKVVDAPPNQPVVPKRGDLLFSRANTRELVAATCLVDRDQAGVFLPDKLWRLTANADVAVPEYLRFLLAHSRFRQTLTRHATGTSGSMLNVSQEKLLRLSLPLPSLVLQRRFAVLVWKAYELRERARENGRELARLFGSLAQRAFSLGHEAIEAAVPPGAK